MYDGNISKVEFYNGSTLLDTDSTFPYNFTWKNVPTGNYKITAKATDNGGLVTTSDTVNVSVGPRTTVTLATPYNIVKYTAGARIKLNATAIAADGKVSKVEFYYSNGYRDYLLGTENEFPYGFLSQNFSAGDYTCYAKAYNDKGYVTTSDSIHILVVEENTPPVVSIVSPVADTTYTGPATIRLIAEAKDPNDKISKVEFYNGTALLRTEYYYPYTYTWINVQYGTYNITAKAYDDKGLSTTSKPVTVIVTNASIVSRPYSENNKMDGTISLKLSPNPTGNILHIYASGLQENKKSTILVLSSAGDVIKTINSNNSDKVILLNVSSFSSGVYAIKVISGDKMMFKKFVKL